MSEKVRLFSISQKQTWNSVLLGFAASFLFISASSKAEKIDEVFHQDRVGLKASQQAQKKVEALDDQTLAIVEQYRQVLREQQLADKYNQLLNKQIDQLEAALAEIEAKQTQLRATRMMLGPLLEEMVESLALLVQADAPFLLPERQARVANLKRLLVDASLSEGEKVLSVLDAYQVELSYGYTTESWQGRVDGALVNFVRVGRLGFYYFTPDEKQAAVWQQGWQPLSVDWIEALKQAAEVASGQQLPSLLTLPAINIENK
ncbi:hypothetical protein BIY21_08255 [Vibrio ponticus]|uniref:DUF3450 domain-containing protein n=1 Tax=Vibrio ponticus TaxID=265668 RepID=A0ABX3FKG7_9VIBR|nr:DUF3450 domain-containing protein [Vibrio ponticus]OLQ94701.1 hypothetical protein BIY21_08255 [Vibrio ponticus]